MKLRDARESANFTQESLVWEISNYTKCSLRNYQKIEKGLVSPNITLALVICEILKVDPRVIDEWQY